jgi:hypothetical protein
MPGLDVKLPPVFEFGVKLTFHTQENMAFDTPMISDVTRRVFNHADADVCDVLCSRRPG